MPRMKRFDHTCTVSGKIDLADLTRPITFKPESGAITEDGTIYVRETRKATVNSQTGVWTAQLPWSSIVGRWTMTIKGTRVQLWVPDRDFAEFSETLDAAHITVPEPEPTTEDRRKITPVTERKKRAES